MFFLIPRNRRNLSHFIVPFNSRKSTVLYFDEKKGNWLILWSYKAEWSGTVNDKIIAPPQPTKKFNIT